MFLGLRTVIYHVDDLARGKAWYRGVVGKDPYYDEVWYVGFDVGGYELGLLPPGGAKDAAPGRGGVDAYWGVDDIEAVHARLLEYGAKELGEIEDLGEGLKVARVLDPFGNVVGIIENPHFRPGEAG